MNVSARTGRKIGLFGGSFNPAHKGHLHVAETGLKALGLDEVWWIVSPANPLKSNQPPYEDRVASVKRLGLPANMKVSHMERDFGTNYTVDTLSRALNHWPNIRFVFLMGADNLAQLPQWKDWRNLMEMVPIAVIARQGAKVSDSLKARLSLPARLYSQARLGEHAAQTLPDRPPPVWVYLTPPLNRLSSTALRAAKNRRGA